MRVTDMSHCPLPFRASGRQGAAGGGASQPGGARERESEIAPGIPALPHHLTSGANWPATPECLFPSLGQPALPLMGKRRLFHAYHLRLFTLSWTSVTTSVGSGAYLRVEAICCASAVVYHARKALSALAFAGSFILGRISSQVKEEIG